MSKRKSTPVGTIGPKPVTGSEALLVGTRKGFFILHGDKSRRAWKLAGPIHLGGIVHHMVMDPRDGRTILMVARTGHLGADYLSIHRSRQDLEGGEQAACFPQSAWGENGLVLRQNFWLSPGHPDEPDVWYAGSSPPGLFRSEDGGITWEGVAGFNKHPMRSTWVGALGDEPPDYSPQWARRDQNG